MTFVIVVTANHFIVDALLGALTAGASALRRALARPRAARGLALLAGRRARARGGSATAPAMAPSSMHAGARAARHRRRAARPRRARAPIGSANAASSCATG